MKKIYYYLCENFGEIDGFFDKNGKLLHAWDHNDAMYRREYMKPLFERVGIDIQELPDDYIDNANKQIEEYFGFDYK